MSMHTCLIVSRSLLVSQEGQSLILKTGREKAVAKSLWAKIREFWASRRP